MCSYHTPTTAFEHGAICSDEETETLVNVNVETVRNRLMSLYKEISDRDIRAWPIYRWIWPFADISVSELYMGLCICTGNLVLPIIDIGPHRSLSVGL